jgi:hypothetical protein
VILVEVRANSFEKWAKTDCFARNLLDQSSVIALVHIAGGGELRKETSGRCPQPGEVGHDALL